MNQVMGDEWRFATRHPSQTNQENKKRKAETNNETETSYS
jgi:hypothetical protein